MIPIGTTPTFTLTFTDENLDLTSAQNVYVTFHSANKSSSLTKTGEDLTIEEKSIAVYLAQEETLAFYEGDVEIQANWTSTTGGRCASDVVTYTFGKQLLKEVLE